MRSFKKLIAISLLIAVSVSSLFATAEAFTPSSDVAYKLVANPYRKTSARMLSMGGAGIALRSNQDALYVNPASLGEKGLVWNVPNTAVTLYNARDLIATGIIDNASNIQDNAGEYADAIIAIYGKGGYNNIMTMDAGVGAKLGRLALASDVQFNMLTYTTPEGAFGLSIIPQVDVVFSAGLGLRFFRDSAINFDIGAAVRVNAKAYYEKVDANYVLSNINNMNQIMTELTDNKPVMVACSIPVDLGFNLNLPAGFTFSTVARNINGNFKAQVYDSIKDTTENVDKVLNGNVTIESPMSFDLGFGWKPKYGLSWLANPNIAVDFVDLGGLVSDFSFSGIFAHMKAGIEVELLRLLELRAGLNQGYVSIGAGVNLMNLIHLEASYYRLEFGEKLLDKPVDALTVRMNLFWER